MEKSPVIIRIKKTAEENNKIFSTSNENNVKKVIYNTRKEAKNLQKNQSKYRRIKKLAATITHNDEKNLNKDTNKDAMEYCTNCHKIFSSVRALKSHIFIANFTSSVCHKKNSFNPLKKIKKNNLKKVTASKEICKIPKKNLEATKKEISKRSTKKEITLEHEKQFEIISVTFRCEKCNYSTSNDSEMIEHYELFHLRLKIDPVTLNTFNV